MRSNKNYLQPELISVEERDDLRRSPRVTPAGLQAEVAFASSPHGTECQCLNLSHHGAALLCDLTDVLPGERAWLTLWDQDVMVRDMPGVIIRREDIRQFSRFAVRFDEPQLANARLNTLIRPGEPAP